VQAVILAAGRGSRLARRTRDRPKCLVEIAGRTLLDWQLGALLAAGVASPVTVVCGYRGDQLRDARIATVVNARWETTNVVRSLLAAARHLRAAPTVVAYGDVVYHPDHVRTLANASEDVAITWDRRWAELWRARFADPLLDAERFAVDDRRRVRVIGGRAASLAEIGGQFMGLVRWTPAGWAHTEDVLAPFPPADVDAMDTTTLLAHVIAAGVAVGGVAVDGRWCEFDSEDDLALSERRLHADERWSHDWRWERRVGW
jgi:choline kinase